MPNKVETVFIIITVLGILHTIDGKLLNRSCGYDNIKLEGVENHALNFSLDAQIIYRIHQYQDGCTFNITEMYANITNNIKFLRSEMYVTVTFLCAVSNEIKDIHFISVDNHNTKTSFPKISVQITLAECSIYLNELTQFQNYGRIWSIVTTNSSKIYRGSSCAGLKDLRMLSTTQICDDNNSTENGTRFFWETCTSPFEQLFNLRIQGCPSNHYKIKQNVLQRTFPKLQTLWMKYINMTSQLIFPWTNVYIDSSDADIIAYLSYYNESFTEDSTSIARSLNIYNSEAKMTLEGHMKKIVINNLKQDKFQADLFTNVSGLSVLDISSNGIQELDKNTFLKQSKLKYLYMSWNKITSLPTGVFDNLKSLAYLDLSSNKISKVDQQVFKHLTQLQQLNLENNHLTVLPPDFLQDQIQIIEYVYLSMNPLKVIPVNLLYAPRMMLIDIRQCQINANAITKLLEEINMFELQTAYSESLTYDPLGTVGRPPLQVRTLDLTGNKINDIPLDLTVPDTTLKLKFLIEAFHVILDKNPLDCTCHILLPAILQQVYVQEGTLINWKCMYPLELRGRLIPTIAANEVYCPVTVKNCPSKCACFERAGYQMITEVANRNRTFIIDCRNVNMTRLPEVMPIGKLELWFQNASLVEMSRRQYFKNVSIFDISNNRINVLTPLTANSLRNVSTLKLDHNNLTHLPIQLTSGNISTLTLGRNPFICDCKTRWMKTWLLLRTSPVTDWNTIECTYDSSKVKQLVSVADSMFVCKELAKASIQEHVIFPSVIIGCMLLVLVSLSLLVYFQKSTVKILLYMYCGFHPFNKQKEMSANMEFDAFVIYSHLDKKFIQDNIITKLLHKGYKVADVYEDLIIGFSFLDNAAKFINKSRRVIFCWTEEMMENDFALSAWNISFERALKYDMSSIILVVDGNVQKWKCKDENLRNFLRRGKFIKKGSKYLYHSVEYQMPRTGINERIQETSSETAENTIPMLLASSEEEYFKNQLVYLSYPEELDNEIRKELVPYLQKIGHDVRIAEHDFTPGADIRDEIYQKLVNSHHFMFIVSKETMHDDVKMFILTTVMSKSMLSNHNYLLLFTSGPLHDAELPNDLENYFRNYMTGSVRDQKFRQRLIQALHSCNNSILHRNNDDSEVIE